MSSINNVRNLQILYFSKKNKEIKNLKKWRKKVVRYRYSYTVLSSRPVVFCKKEVPAYLANFTSKPLR